MMLVRIPAGLPSGDDLLVRLSERNPGFKIERDASGEITMAHPNGGFGGAKSFEAAMQLHAYARVAGGKAFDASQGWKIGPNDAVRAPDASWLSEDRVAGVSHDEREGSAFLAIVPDVIVEVRSPSDDWPALLKKLDEYRDRGAGYAVGIDPRARLVVERGATPDGLTLDFEAIMNA